MIQAIELVRKDVFTVGLQWHPELMPHSAVQMFFFRALVRAPVEVRLLESRLRRLKLNPTEGGTPT